VRDKENAAIKLYKQQKHLLRLSSPLSLIFLSILQFQGFTSSSSCYAVAVFLAPSIIITAAAAKKESSSVCSNFISS
jgi:hypothetical protein